MSKNRLLRLILAVLAVSGVMTVASVADAQQAYVYTRTSLRAGPDHGYPQVAWLGGGTTVYINGCVRGYNWCDVTSGPFRGWANARHLQYFYNNQRVMVYGNGGRFGFPVVGFALGSYWDNYYRGQSWYSNREHWNGWRPGTPAPRFNNYYAPGHPQYHGNVAPHAGFAPQHQQQFQQGHAPQQVVRERAPVHQQMQQHAPVQHQQMQQHAAPVRQQPQQHNNNHLNQNGSLR